MPWWRRAEAWDHARMNANQIVSALVAKGFTITNKQGRPNTYLEPNSPDVRLLASTRLVKAGVAPNRHGRTGAIYVHAPRPGVAVRLGDDGVLTANGGHRDVVQGTGIAPTGTMKSDQNPAWRGTTVAQLLQKL